MSISYSFVVLVSLFLSYTGGKMFNQSVKRIGFACKIQESHDKPLKSCATSATTITWLNAQTKDRAVERLWDLTKSNMLALKNQVLWISKQPQHLRMFRISSDLLTAYTHDNWMWFYFESEVQTFLERELKSIGDLARANDVRLSFHPGQFCVLASDRPDVVENSIVEFEYHCDIIRYMGYGQQFQDFKCNVHISGKQGPEGIRKALKVLSKEARNCLTIENAEYTWGLNASLELVKDCALVLDIHHHWIASGEYIEPGDTRIKLLQESWRGVRPAMHYSVSREMVIPDHDPHTRPNLVTLKAQGFTSAKLRAHSDYYWNTEVNDWALSHNSWADIMCEAKQKNLASFKLAELLT